MEITNKIDLSICKKGDILISHLGGILEYVKPLPEEHYFDHEVKYLKVLKDNGDEFPEFGGSSGTRTNEGFVYKNNRIKESDHDIIAIIKVNKEESVLIK